MLNEKWQCPVCFENNCDVRIIEHRDSYATGDSLTECEVITSCCGVDAADINTYCQCGSMVYDDGMCLDCYKKAGTLADERHDKKYIIERAIKLSNSVEDAGGHLFFEYSPHVNGISLRAFLAGWTKGASADRSVDVYLCGLNGCPRKIYDAFEQMIRKEIGNEQLETTCGL